MNNGSWNDVATVWSADGGITPCGCSPGAISAGNDILINHDINSSFNITINGGSVFTVSLGANLTGGDDILALGSRVDIFGTVSLKKVDLGVGGTIDLHPGAMLFASNKLSVNAGILTMNGALINCGGLDIGAAGSMFLTNSSRLSVVSGNAVNDGLLDIGTNSCMSSNGNWKNNGTISGSGALNSGGNLQNSGTFSVAIAWCSNGAGLGLPTPEDCTTSDVICNAITLPVELSRFVAQAVDKDYINIAWETRSENNSSHFIALSSQDGKNWEEIETVDAAGNTNETQYYSIEDYDVRYGTTYFKLIQVDLNNDTYESEVISVSIAGEEVEIGVYPNPIRNSDALTVSNLDANSGRVNIMNISGQIVATQEIDVNQTKIKVQISDLLPGIYIVSVEQLGVYKTKRLVITE
jgi:hypothetical protein